MKGFRVPPQLSKNESVQSLGKELENMQMAARVSQMMIQQLMQNMKGMSEDLGSMSSQLYELQYNFSALKKHLNIDNEAVNKIANEQRLKDFEEAAAKADAKDGLVEAATVGDDSTVTITSTASDSEGNDRSIFRSRVKLSETGPELIAALKDKAVGEKVTATLNGVQHSVELLAIRNPAPISTEASQEVAVH